MNSVWTLELGRFLIALAIGTLVGAVTSFWAISYLSMLSIYLVWLLTQLHEFETWIRKGANKSEAPDNSGIWQQLVQHTYRSQKSHKERKQQLADMAHYYHTVMRALPDATVVVNQNLEIEWANQISNKLLGIKPSKDVGQRLHNILRIPEIEQLFDPELKVNRVVVESPFESNITLSVSRVEYEAGYSLLIAQDVSQRVATQKLRKAFIANASHELRTPLTVISGYLEIMQDDEDTPRTLLPIINSAYDQASRMDNILDNLLLLSKLEEKSYSKTSGDEVDVSELLERIVADFRVSYADRKHEFVIQTEPIKIRVVETEFYSICQNLLTNAVKYSPVESVIKICWSLNDSGFGCLSVTDQGEGIAVEHLARLTERFYRVNQNRNQQVGGTGLGLSIVKHILDNFGGYLDIQSEVGKGSTFKACLPSYRLIERT